MDCIDIGEDIERGAIDKSSEEETTGRIKLISSHIIIPLWVTNSIALVLFNKLIFSSQGFGFRYPIFLTTVHLLFATIATRLMRRFNSPLVKGVGDVKMDWTAWSKTILPIAVCFSGSLIMSNVSYLLLTVSFVQILKTFAVVVIMIVSSLFGIEKLSKRSIFWGTVISLGVVISSLGEFSFVVTGVLAQLQGVVFDAVRLVLTEKLFHHFKMGPVESLYFFAPVCFVGNLVPLFLYEGWQPFFQVMDRVGIFVLALNCLMSLSLNIAAVYLVSSTSSVTFTLTSTFKDIMLVMGSATYFGNVVAPIQFVGYGTSLLGILALKCGEAWNQFFKNFLQPKMNIIMTDDETQGSYGRI
ncbi:hypothetical protein PROFUN_02763 [Planoprotostelium fungivorum]|uniref:Sugar phosphate transporter domain-containing protein n=1 Tax=Planoprotostelium fungivorum TaxID=1890364 RepID=A0A2P6NXI2_9EUKA|nr:hypothetical protein PROFUN_02763 [Planoprotostelium fungivorum]